MREVLVVDDDPGMRVALEASFRCHGWRVETASGALDALSKFRHRLHALVITYIRMPDGTGLEVMREIRQVAPQTAVILLTAFGLVSLAGTVLSVYSGRSDGVNGGVFCLAIAVFIGLKVSLDRQVSKLADRVDELNP